MSVRLDHRCGGRSKPAANRNRCRILKSNGRHRRDSGFSVSGKAEDAIKQLRRARVTTQNVKPKLLFMEIPSWLPGSFVSPCKDDYVSDNAFPWQKESGRYLINGGSLADLQKPTHQASTTRALLPAPKLLQSVSPSATSNNEPSCRTVGAFETSPCWDGAYQTFATSFDFSTTLQAVPGGLGLQNGWSCSDELSNTFFPDDRRLELSDSLPTGDAGDGHMAAEYSAVDFDPFFAVGYIGAEAQLSVNAADPVYN